MSKTPKNHGEPWIPPENAQLRQLSREKTPIRVVGLKLGHTKASVRSQAHREDVSLKPTNQSQYNRQKRYRASSERDFSLGDVHSVRDRLGLS